MPQFRLDGPARLPTHSRKSKIIYTKNLYSDKVKVEHWQELLEHNPIDVDPFCQGKVNYFLSHYHRLGSHDGQSYRTTTQDMLEQVFIKDKMGRNKLMDNYYTYNDKVECEAEGTERQCPAIIEPYLTTMQHSYRVPKPYIMQRLAFPKIPFMQNQKYRHEIPELSSEKFHDENFQYVTCQLHKHKGFRWSSFNPMTGNYTNPRGIPST